MRFKKYLIVLPLFLFFLLFVSHPLFAKDKQVDKPVITIINPIRGHELGLENTDLLASLKSQWQITKNADVRATWLWQYSALKEQNLMQFANSNFTNQEDGVFLEIDHPLAQKASVMYKGQGPWYFSDGLLLSSYDKDEQKKLIDTVFATFKEKFGYYPKTVGAWWVGAYAIDYMQQNYGIVTVLQCADQFNTDAYSIWGTPWSIPYTPDKTNAAIPAKSSASKTPVAILQWASRDPNRAYGGSGEASTFSMQDYQLKNYDISYFDYLMNIYLKKPLDNMVIGLEGGLRPEIYNLQYKEQLTRAKALADQDKIVIEPASEYGAALLASGQTLPKTSYFLSKDYIDTDQAFWYNSSTYRIGIQKKGNAVYVVDLRDYKNTGTEDFFNVPNSQGLLRINTKAVIDSIRFPKRKILLATTSAPLIVKSTSTTVTLLSNKQTIGTFTPERIELSQQGTPLVFSFGQTQPSLNVFLWLFLLYLLYFVLVTFLKKNNHIVISTASLFIPLLFAYPLLDNGTPSDLTFFITQQMLFLLSLAGLLPFSLPINLLLVLQVLPFVLLLLVHFLLIVLKKTKEHRLVLYYLFAGLILFLYIHLPYFALDSHSKKTLAVAVFATLLYGITTAFIFFKTKSKQLVFFMVILFAVAGFLVVFSRKVYVLTPFEQTALQVVRNTNGQTTYAVPTDQLLYKAVKPILLDNYQFVAFLTQKNWQSLTLAKDKPLPEIKNTNVLIIPRYLGVTIPDIDFEKQGFTKTFDNAQIAIFSKK